MARRGNWQLRGLWRCLGVLGAVASVFALSRIVGSVLGQSQKEGQPTAEDMLGSAVHVPPAGQPVATEGGRGQAQAAALPVHHPALSDATTPTAESAAPERESSAARREALERLLDGAAAAGVPPEAASKPLVSCHMKKASEDPPSWWEEKFREAMKMMCEDKVLWPLMEVYLDRRFLPHFLRVYGRDGWAEEAWVNFVTLGHRSNYFAQLTEKMVDSVHRYSTKPVIVVNFGTKALPLLEPDRFPHMVMFHARMLDRNTPLKGPQTGVSFNFNKLRAVLLARVKVGASIESDMMFVNPHADELLNRTREETTEHYPFPMMPTHFLDRDPFNAKLYQAGAKGSFSPYQVKGSKNFPVPTMRWGQAQPTWTFWSLPFFARWLAAKLHAREEQGVPVQNIQEDEDLLNVALWREGAWKAWCLWQFGGTDFVWNFYIPQKPHWMSPFYPDPKRFPGGIPIAWYFAHAEKKLEDYDKAFDALEKFRASGKPLPKTFVYGKRFYVTFAELQAENQGLNCTM